MAPPIPGLRRPVAVKRRTAGDVAAGVLAILALAVLTLGVPLALVTVLGLPIPHSRPTLGLLTHQLSILNVIRILSVVVWLAWLQLVFCVLAEIRAATNLTSNIIATLVVGRWVGAVDAQAAMAIMTSRAASEDPAVSTG